MSGLLAYEEGGPNDPRVAFNALRESLGEAKDELSPWAWRTYAAEFKERQVADRKLRALNSLPGSGHSEEEGVVESTPLWQERLDHLLLVEHLKAKITAAHGKFTKSSDLLLQSHGWLVREFTLADKFVECITHVPESQHNRIDFLQMQIEAARKDIVRAKNDFEDYKIQQSKKRDEYLVRVTVHQKEFSYPRNLCDDILVGWSYRAQREQVLQLRAVRETNERRIAQLEADLADTSHMLRETRAAGEESHLAMEQDRNLYKKKFERMVEAHRKAQEEAKKWAGTAEGQAKAIEILTQEKEQLIIKVEGLEDDKRRMAKQLADLRDELAKLRQQLVHVRNQLQESESVLTALRLDVLRLEEIQGELEGGLDESVIREAQLEGDLEAQQRLTADANTRTEVKTKELAGAKCQLVVMARQRDDLRTDVRSFQSELSTTISDYEEQIRELKAQAKQDLQDFKDIELGRVKEEFRKQTEAILRRNERLEREVLLCDNVTPHLAALRPMGFDAAKICAMCRKGVVFEGKMSM